jgi:hypothetical protein
MSIDKQRMAAVAALEALGFKYTSDRGWFPPFNTGRGGTPPDFTAEADAMHALLVLCADALMDAPEATDGATNFSSLPTQSKHMKSSAGREARYRAGRAEIARHDALQRRHPPPPRQHSDGNDC